MHARMTVTLVALALVGGSLLVPALAGPAAADGDQCGRCLVTPTEDGLLGRVQSQVNELNTYVRQPTPCTYTDTGGVEQTGFLRWRLSAVAQDTWDRMYGGDFGTMYRRECWAPAAGEFGELLDLREFPDINGENLARLAMDQFLLGLPAPEPRLNPEGTTLVNLETWLSVDNIPAGSLTSPPISVPDITVVVTAEAGGVEWTMGDGTAPFTCAGTGTDGVSAPRTCWHYYRRSSAGEADGQFHGTARIVWIGTYTVNGHSAGVEIPVPREAPFAIQVAEAQAVIVR